MGIPWSLTKRNVKSCTWGTITHIPCYRLRTDWVLKRTGSPQAEHQLTMCPCGKGSQHHPGLCLEESHQQVQGGGFSPWFNLMEATFRVLCLILVSLVEERRGLMVCIQKRATKTVKHLEVGKTDGELGLCSLRRRRLWESHCKVYKHLMGRRKEDGTRLFSVVPAEVTQCYGDKLKYREFPLNIGKYFTARVSEHWNRLPRGLRCLGGNQNASGCGPEQPTSLVWRRALEVNDCQRCFATSAVQLFSDWEIWSNFPCCVIVKL